MIDTLRKPSQAEAIVKGTKKYKDIEGKVKFYKYKKGVLVYADISGLPKGIKPCGSPIFAFHIHDEKGHYNPNKCEHPYHAGDLPPLFGADGTAILIVYTTRFKIPEILGKTVVIHEFPDDFTTQPSGNPGEMIATGTVSLITKS